MVGFVIRARDRLIGQDNFLLIQKNNEANRFINNEIDRITICDRLRTSQEVCVYPRRPLTTPNINNYQSDRVFPLSSLFLTEFDDFFPQSYLNPQRSSNFHSRTCTESRPSGTPNVMNALVLSHLHFRGECGLMHELRITSEVRT